MKNRKHSIKVLLAIALCVAAIFSITAILSARKPLQANTDNVTMTGYGTMDRSMASQGYITFTPSGQARCFVLQGPDDEQVFFPAQKDETIKIPLADGAGKYQYAIADTGSDGKTCTVQYKNSFDISKIDTSLSTHPVSAPWGG